MARGKTNRRRNVVSYSQYIDGEVQKTRRQVKLTEVSAALVTLFLGMLLFLLAAVVIDHWVLPLKAMGRWGMLLALIGGVGAFAFIRLVPLLFRRVNPVYAAKAIEERSPAMNNSLVNHLMLRDNRQGASRGVLRAVEKQAAQSLSKTSAEGAVDRSKLLRLGYLLLGLMLICAFYKFFSPKDPLTTFSRIAAPWTEVAAPTRVQIEQIRPGKDTWVYADAKSVEVEAVVRGLRRDEPVKLYWSTHDGRVENQEIEMQPVGGGSRRFRGYLPEENRNLQQSVSYFIAAGDAQSRVFRIEVRTMPLIAVKRVKYEYPPYTRQPPRTQEGGAIAAVEGTWVTVEAEANQRIQTAVFDAHCDGLRIRPMKVSGKTASIRFQLQAKGALAAGRLNQYLIRFTNDEGHETPAPPRHAFIVRRDPPPAVQIVRPQQRAVKLPINGSLTIQVQATDREYGLWSVALKAELKQQANVLLMTEPLLGGGGDFPQEFSGSFEFSPRGDRSLRRLQVGDTVEIWAEATDNRHNASGKIDPNPKTRSNRIVVKIIEADESLRPDSKNEDPPPKRQPGKPADKTGAREDQSTKQPKNGKHENQDKNSSRSDGEKNDEKTGDAGANSFNDHLQRLNEQIKKEQQKGSGSPNGNDRDRKDSQSPQGQQGPVGANPQPKADAEKRPMGQSKSNGQKLEGRPGKKGEGANDPPLLKPTANPEAKGRAKTAKDNALLEKKGDPMRSKMPPNNEPEGGIPQDSGETSGDGNPSKDPKPSPASIGKNKTDIKKVNKRQESNQEDTSADAPTMGKKPTNDRGGNKGVDKGDGSKGGGNRSDGQGAGKSGKNTSANDGGGVSPETGSGPDSKKAGTKSPADRSTGHPGTDNGQGSTNTQDGMIPGGSNSPPDAEPKQHHGKPTTKTGLRSGNNHGKSSGRAPAGGLGNRNPLPDDDSVDTRPGELDKEAALKRMDLILKHLTDHPDESGFTSPKELERFKQQLIAERSKTAATPDSNVFRNRLRELFGPLTSRSRQSASGNLESIKQSEQTKYPDNELFQFESGTIRPRRK